MIIFYRNRVIHFFTLFGIVSVEPFAKAISWLGAFKIRLF